MKREGQKLVVGGRFLAGKLLAQYGKDGIALIVSL